MLQWQKKHIQRYRSVLVENRESSATLIASLLKTGDLDDSEFSKWEESRDQSSRLYETLQFSSKGYETLTRAAYECEQVEILKILLNGFREQKIKDPLKQCRIPISVTGIPSTDISMKGCKLKVKNFFSESDLSSFEAIIEEYQLEYDYIATFITRDKKLELPQTIPEQPAIYIPRFVSNRLNLDPAIFHENLEDFFLFKGLKKYYELTNLAKPNDTTTFEIIAENQVMDKSCRFIWLEEKYENVWEEILKLSGSTPVHLVTVENKEYFIGGQYILEATSNFLSIQRWFVEQPKNKEYFIGVQYILEATSNFQSIKKWVVKQPKKMTTYTPEEKFVKIIANNNGNPGFCICDTPGMGKSYLLASLARKNQASHPDWVVVYAKFANLIKDLKEHKTRLWMNPSIAPNLILEHIVSSQILVRLLVDAVTRGSKRLELFLDGLDELTSDEDLKLMKMFLKAIIKFQTGRGNVYVTARPHVQADLEETLGVAAYDILPFSEENQIEFLEKYWVEKWKVEDEERSELMKEFAKSCLEKIEKPFNGQVREIMGIPLKCFLLAGIHESDAKRVLSCGVLEDNPIVKNYSIYDLLEEYIDTRKPSTITDCAWDAVQNLHIWKALEVQIGSDFAKKYADFKKLKTDFPEEYYSFGILTKSANEPIFIHQTFIEFLVILCFGELIQSVKEYPHNLLLEEMIRHLANDIVFKRYEEVSTIFSKIYPSYLKTQGHPIYLQTFTFPNQVHLYFFNKYLWNNQDSIEPLTSSEILATSLDFISKEAYSILQCCFHNNYIYILRFIKNLFQNGWKRYESLAEPSIQLDLFNETTQQSPIVLLVFIAARTSSVEIMRELEDLLGSCKCKLSQVELPICENFKVTPLHIAAERGNLKLFLLLWRSSSKPEELLLWCTHNSLESESSAVVGKEQICEFLFSIMSKDGLNLAFENAIYEKKVHSHIIEFLLYLNSFLEFKRRGEKFQTVGDIPPNQTGLSIVAKLVKNVLLQYLYAAHIDDCLLGKILESSVFSLKLIDERVREEDEDTKFGDSLLLALVRRNRGRLVLEALEKDELVNNFKNKKGQNALHVAAERYGKVDVDVIEYLHSKGLLLEERDSEGNTPLLLAHENLEMIECFLKVKANAAATNTVNKKNLLHLMATHYYLDEDNIGNHLRVVKTLIDGGIDVNAKDSPEGRFPLLSYLLTNDLNSLKYRMIADLLVKHGADINACDNKGNNLLFWGAYHRQHPQVLEYLEGKEVEWKDILNRFGDTIFHMAAKGGSVEFLENILKKSDSEVVNKENNEGKTPLLSAMVCKEGRDIVIKMINLFADKNADFGAVDTKGNNAIFLATYHGQDEEVLELLEERNVDWKCTNENGDCILHMAAKARKAECLNYFLAKPDWVDINARNNEEKTPLLSAFTKTSDDLMEMKFHARNVKGIVESLTGNENLNINAVDKDGNNALHLALISGMPARIIENLKGVGCNPDTPNNKGKTFNQLFNISMESDSFRRDRDMLDSAYEDYIGEGERPDRPW